MTEYAAMDDNQLVYTLEMVTNTPLGVIPTGLIEELTARFQHVSNERDEAIERLEEALDEEEYDLELDALSMNIRFLLKDMKSNRHWGE